MISTKGRYALRVLLDLAEHRNSTKPIPLKDVAERQEISKKYLEIIVKELVSAGYVTGVSGKGGGYRLKCDPETTTVGEVLELMEGTLAPVACLNCKEPYECARRPFCKTLPMWKEFDSMVHDFFYGRTLQDLVGTSPEAEGDYYVI